MATVAVTGASGYLGRKLLQALESNPAVTRVVGIDVREPSFSTRNLEFYRLDVRAAELADALTGSDVLVHLAASRLADLDEMRDVNVGGTRLSLEAASRAGVRKVVYASTVLAYGAHPDNDFPLTEESPLRPIRDFPYSAHKAEAEETVRRFGDAHPDLVVTVLRPCQIVGPTVSGPPARRLESPYAIAVDGYEPPVQALHEDDAAAAVVAAVERDLPGTYNLCPQDWVSAAEASQTFGQRRVVLDRDRAHRLLTGLWRVGLGTVPPSYLPFVMYPTVASSAKLAAAGITLRYTTADALRAGAEARREWVSFGKVRFRPRRTLVTVGSLGAVVVGSAARSAVARRRLRRGKA